MVHLCVRTAVVDWFEGGAMVCRSKCTVVVHWRKCGCVVVVCWCKGGALVWYSRCGVVNRSRCISTAAVMWTGA